MPVLNYASTYGVLVATLCFAFAVWYVYTVRKRQKELGIKNITLKIPRWLRVITIGGLLITAGAAGYAISFYQAMISLDDNLAYMALYYDDMAVDLYQAGDSMDSVLFASGIASQYCSLYQIEKRQFDHDKYDSICSVVYNRTMLFSVCSDDQLIDLCTDERLDQLDALILEAEPLGEQLKTQRPYFGNVFSPEYRSSVCFLGGEEVPCSW